MVSWPSFLQRDTELTTQSELTVGYLTAWLTERSCNAPLEIYPLFTKLPTVCT